MKRVVLTGMGCVTAIGNTVEAFRDALFAGRTGIAPLDPAFPGCLGETPGLRFSTTARVAGFDAAQHLASGILSATDAGAQFGIVAARQAAASSGMLAHHDPATVAIITGCACGGRSADEDALRNLYVRNARVPPFTIVRTMSSAGASNIAIDLGIGGPVFNVASACASGTHAIGLAFQMVRSGMVSAAIAGGYEAPLTFGFLRAWDSMRVVSPTSCRPLSADRDGMTLGEGAAMLAIEPLEAALARRATIYAEIVGFGMSADAHHITQPKPEGAALAIERALADAAPILTSLGAPGLASETWESAAPKSQMDLRTLHHRIGYINAHGTGTLTNDAVEAAAIHLALGAAARTIPVSATKSQTGHAIGATAAMEVLIAALALHSAMLPYTAAVTTPDASLDLDIILNAPRPLGAGKDLALSNSLAFGGLNAVLALRRYEGFLPGACVAAIP